ncbi:cupin [Dyella solisilvae]|uniref:Cupin n=1 Tax=Dyella solisilvae TaxID=1920168 RepID=A0A370K2Y4_9GAMM|nr:cupin [Dyella solisilvae]RDI97035.1 cupin [Dyella solisilvae]
MSDNNSVTSMPDAARHQLCPVDPGRYSTFKVGKLQHTYHQHPLFQLPELAQLAKELMPLGHCRFVQPGLTQGSPFAHEERHPDGRGIDEFFQRIEEPGSWIALYHVQHIPRYRTLLGQIMDTVRPLVEREQPGVFDVMGFIFISAPPSVTPFHIDRENNFWLQLHGRKTLSVWDPDDRNTVPADAVEDFIVDRSLKKVRLKDECRVRGHHFDSGPGDGVYFPSTSPHMAEVGSDWVEPGNGISASIGITFYTRHTRQVARIHQLNRILRNQLHITPGYPGDSALADAIKAPLGHLAGPSRNFVIRCLHALRARRSGARMAEAWQEDQAPPGSY